MVRESAGYPSEKEFPSVPWCGKHFNIGQEDWYKSYYLHMKNGEIKFEVSWWHKGERGMDQSCYCGQGNRRCESCLELGGLLW